MLRTFENPSTRTDKRYLQKMNHLITTITFTVILGIVSGAPLLTCDKIKDVSQGKDNQDRYLVILKDPQSYQDAEHIIGLVEMYQRLLDTDTSNVHESSAKSQLEFHDIYLQGTLSQQALLLVSFHNNNYKHANQYAMIAMIYRSCIKF